MTTETVPEPFNAAEFDRDCRNYLAYTQQAEDARTKATEIKARIMAAVERHGHVPDAATRSRSTNTAAFVATVTSGVSVEINDAICTELELVLAKGRVRNLFGQLFTRRVEYTLAKGADVVYAQAKLPKRIAEQVATLYARAFTPKSKAPSLKVETYADVMARALATAAKTAKKPRAKKVAA